MPSNRFVAPVLTGLSSSSDPILYFPDYMIRPFSVSVSAVASSTGTILYSVEHTLDYGSSAFVSSNATWFPSSGLSAASTGGFTAYTYPVTAIRLNSSAGSSTQTIALTIVQAG